MRGCRSYQTAMVHMVPWLFFHKSPFYQQKMQTHLLSVVDQGYETMTAFLLLDHWPVFDLHVYKFA